MQETLFHRISELIPANTSLAEEIASVLDIGYDAAYRRITNKTNLSLTEGVTLAQHYKISLNRLFEVGSQHTLLAERSPKIVSEEDLESYFRRSIENLIPLTRMKSAT